MGVHRALVDSSRRGIVAGLPRARIAGDLRTQAELAFGLLEGGLEGYAVKEQPARAAG